MAAGHGACRSGPSSAAPSVPASSPCLPFPYCALDLVNRGPESQFCKHRRVIHGAAVNHRGNRVPDRAYGWEQIRLALLVLLGFSVWKSELRSGLALDSGELWPESMAAVVSSFPSGRCATLSLSLISFF